VVRVDRRSDEPARARLIHADRVGEFADGFGAARGEHRKQAERGTATDRAEAETSGARGDSEATRAAEAAGARPTETAERAEAVARAMVVLATVMPIIMPAVVVVLAEPTTGSTAVIPSAAKGVECRFDRRDRI
jgi:DNA replication initiation complex subunit (GINS family)